MRGLDSSEPREFYRLGGSFSDRRQTSDVKMWLDEGNMYEYWVGWNDRMGWELNVNGGFGEAWSKDGMSPKMAVRVVYSEGSLVVNKSATNVDRNGIRQQFGVAYNEAGELASYRMPFSNLVSKAMDEEDDEVYRHDLESLKSTVRVMEIRIMEGSVCLNLLKNFGSMQYGVEKTYFIRPLSQPGGIIFKMTELETSFACWVERERLYLGITKPGETLVPCVISVALNMDVEKIDREMREADENWERRELAAGILNLVREP